MCLGSEFVLSVSPKSGFEKEKEKGKGKGKEKEKGAGQGVVGPALGPDVLMPIEDQDVVMGDEDGDGDGTVEQAAPSGGSDGAVPGATATAAGKRAVVKPPKPVISLTLVHGDAVMLSGDEFEYSIKRTGTSICMSLAAAFCVGCPADMLLVIIGSHAVDAPDALLRRSRRRVQE